MSTRSLPLDYDIVVYSGTSYRREFRWLPDGITPIDFVGWDAVLRVGQQSAAAELELTPGNGGIALTSLGQIIVLMTPTQTADLKGGRASFYNLDLTQPDGFVRRFLRGRISVVLDVKPAV